MSAIVNRICQQIDGLEELDRAELFGRLRNDYCLRLPVENAEDAEKPWDDARNQFTRRERQLLDSLDGKGVVDERNVLKHIWAGDYAMATRGLTPRHRELLTEALGRSVLAHDDCTAIKLKRLQIIKNRLRQLEKQTNDKLLKLGSHWQVWRPHYRRLELRLEHRFNRPEKKP